MSSLLLAIISWQLAGWPRALQRSVRRSGKVSAANEQELSNCWDDRPWRRNSGKFSKKYNNPSPGCIGIPYPISIIS